MNTSVVSSSHRTGLGVGKRVDGSEAQAKGKLIQERGHSILIVDDDQGTCDTFSGALRAVGMSTTTAGSGAGALQAFDARTFDAAIVDLGLPDINGLELIKHVSVAFPRTRTIVVSGLLSTEIVVQAVKLGAFAVLDKPIDTEVLRAIVSQSLRDTPNATHTNSSLIPRPLQGEPKSVQERWASMILRAHSSESDPRTLGEVANTVAVSVSTFCEICRLAEVKPLAARDLARMMRAITLSNQEQCAAKIFLNVSHRRTLQSLLCRAGLLDPEGREIAGILTVESFLNRQLFVSQDNKALQRLRTLAALGQKG